MGRCASWGVGGGQGIFMPLCEIWLTNRLMASIQSGSHKALRCVFLFMQEGVGGVGVFLPKVGQTKLCNVYHEL